MKFSRKEIKFHPLNFFAITTSLHHQLKYINLEVVQTILTPWISITITGSLLSLRQLVHKQMKLSFIQSKIYGYTMHFLVNNDVIIRGMQIYKIAANQGMTT